MAGKRQAEIDREIDRFLVLIRRKISDRGYTQLGVQEALGWGRTYISQLLRKQKSLRLDQTLAILGVVGLEPGAFFAELYAARPRTHGRREPKPVVSNYQEPPGELEKMILLLRGLTVLLQQKGLITRAELVRAIEAQREEALDGGP